MKFPGFAVTTQSDGQVTIRAIELDETELRPDSNWMEGYPNTDSSSGCWLGRNLDAALAEVRRLIASPSGSPSFQHLLEMAKDPNIAPEYFCSPTPYYPNTPWKKYDLDQDEQDEILDALLKNPAAPDSFLLEQADDTNWGEVAARCGPDGLRSNKFENAWWLHIVRGGDNLALGALTNPQCPSDILERIFDAALNEWELDPDEISFELAVMAGHPNVSGELLEKLSNTDTDSISIFESIVNNNNCPDALREHVSKMIEDQQAASNSYKKANCKAKSPRKKK